MKQELPTISVLIPVHNEEEILSGQVLRIVEEMRKLENRFELLLIENGSTDRTGEICNRLSRQLPELEVVQIPVGDYGLALKQGIFEAKNDLVVIFQRRVLEYRVRRDCIDSTALPYPCDWFEICSRSA